MCNGSVAPWAIVAQTTKISGAARLQWGQTAFAHTSLLWRHLAPSLHQRLIAVASKPPQILAMMLLQSTLQSRPVCSAKRTKLPVARHSTRRNAGIVRAAPDVETSEAQKAQVGFR